MVVYQYLICFIRYRYPGAVPCRKGSLATGNPLIRKTYVSYDIMFRMFRRKPNPGIRIGIGVFGRSIGAESRRGIRFRSKEGALS